MTHGERNPFVYCCFLGWLVYWLQRSSHEERTTEDDQWLSVYQRNNELVIFSCLIHTNIHVNWGFFYTCFLYATWCSARVAMGQDWDSVNSDNSFSFSSESSWAHITSSINYLQSVTSISGKFFFLVVMVKCNSSHHNEVNHSTDLSSPEHGRFYCIQSYQF